MAIFGTKKKETKPKAQMKAKAIAASSEKVLSNTKLENVIRAPWMSEKALISTEKGIYVFEVPAEATKLQIKAAIERLYKVVPVKVTVANLPGKRKNLRHKRGQAARPARHKAYVHLKKGDTITFA